MPITWPSSPSVNQVHTVGNRSWKWNGSNWARSDVDQGYDPLTTIAASGASTSVDIWSYGVADITLTANCTLGITGVATGQAWSATFILRQDATGGRTVSWPATTRWPGGSAPLLSTAANAIDMVVLMTVNGGTTWFGSLVGKGFA